MAYRSYLSAVGAGKTSAHRILGYNNYEGWRRHQIGR